MSPNTGTHHQHNNYHHLHHHHNNSHHNNTSNNNNNTSHPQHQQQHISSNSSTTSSNNKSNNSSISVSNQSNVSNNNNAPASNNHQHHHHIHSGHNHHHNNHTGNNNSHHHHHNNHQHHNQSHHQHHHHHQNHHHNPHNNQHQQNQQQTQPTTQQQQPTPTQQPHAQPPSQQPQQPPPPPQPSQQQTNSTQLVTRQIYDTFLRARQSNETYIQKAKLREKMYNILLKCFKNSIDLYIVGSSINNLGNNTSDVDMCLILDRDINQTTEALPILQFVRDQIRQYDFVRRSHLIMAKVPLLRFEDASSAVVVDLNVNNSVGIRNTHLINCYTRLDRRVQPLVIVIKLWARKNRINDAYNKTLSSYSLVLMVIHYLQCGCNPPVLPCLQKMMPDVFKPNSDIKRLDLLEPLPDFLSRNTQSLGDLLLGFLYYFSYIFKFSVDVISIRLGSTIDKEAARSFVSAKNTPTQWRWICIEEPFDRTNTARSVWDEQAFSLILNVFRSSHYRLERSRNLNAIL